jgi:hypothetical protein
VISIRELGHPGWYVKRWGIGIRLQASAIEKT